jgi:hypothetical protein
MTVLLQTEAAVKQFGVVTLGFAGNSEHVVFDYVRVRKPDGSVVETPLTDAQEMPQDVTRAAPFYSDLKEVQIPVRSLAVGDRLEYRAREMMTKAEAPGQFWGEHRLTEGVVVLDETVELRFPKSKAVTVWSPTIKPLITADGGDRVYQWTNSAIDPTVGRDAEAKKEANKKRILTDAEQLDSTEGKFPQIAWTTFKSWADLGEWYRSLEAPRAVADNDVKAKVAELTAGKTTEDDKVRALYEYVSTQIRYIGVAFGVGRYQPHMAGDVLRNQYGDCKDKHTLLAAMLDAAGIQSDAVLIGANIRFNKDVPSPGAFNHMITAVPVEWKSHLAGHNRGDRPLSGSTVDPSRQGRPCGSRDRRGGDRKDPGEPSLPNGRELRFQWDDRRQRQANVADGDDPSRRRRVADASSAAADVTRTI